MTADDLPGFLLARIAEDESVARRAEESPGSYRGHPTKTAPLWTVSAASVYGREVGPRGSVEATPGRVLADCAAKRAIVAMHVREIPEDEAHIRSVEGPPFRAEDQACEALWLDASDIDCQTLRLLAQPYADHPDFRDEWRADG